MVQYATLCVKEALISFVEELPLLPCVILIVRAKWLSLPLLPLLSLLLLASDIC